MAFTNTPINTVTKAKAEIMRKAPSPAKTIAMRLPDINTPGLSVKQVKPGEFY